MTFSYTGGGLTCGYEVGPAIGDGYSAPFSANVEIDQVVVDVSGNPHVDPAAAYDQIMSRTVRKLPRIAAALAIGALVDHGVHVRCVRAGRRRTDHRLPRRDETAADVARSPS